MQAFMLFSANVDVIVTIHRAHNTSESLLSPMINACAAVDVYTHESC